LDGEFVREYSIHHTMSLAYELGRRFHAARARNTDPVAAVCEVTHGQRLFSGKVLNVQREHEQGFTTGRVELTGMESNDSFTVEFQNEFSDVNESTTVIESDVIINNPNPFGVRLAGLAIDYAVEMNGVRMATGGREGVGDDADVGQVRHHPLCGPGDRLSVVIPT
jgi:hypothetical protein